MSYSAIIKDRRALRPLMAGIRTLGAEFDVIPTSVVVQ